MRLTPRYGDSPVISIDVRAGAAHPMVGQRARLEAFLRDLSEEEWLQPSRCAGWTVQDVVSHLTTVNGFWALAIGAGAAGKPTRYLSTFDPVTSPAELVEQGRGAGVAETLEQFAASCAGLAAVVEGLTEEDWLKPAEAPPGHLPITLVADHGLWDAWVHERDILLPLGRTPEEDGVEVLTCLRYVAALGPAFGVCAGAAEVGSTVLEVTDPDARIVVTVEGDAVRVHDGPVPDGAMTGGGDAVQILEMLSLRDTAVMAPEAVRSLTAGLALTFDQPSVV